MSMDTPMKQPLAEATQECTTPIPIVLTESGFTQLEIEHINLILVRIAIRMKEINSETLPEKATDTVNNVQPMGDAIHPTRYKSGHIRQTVYDQPSEKQHHINGNANR